jgi:hypothetical protein
MEAGSRESCFFSSDAFKPMLIHGKGEPGDSHPIINEWEGAWVVPEQCEAPMTMGLGESHVIAWLQ